MDGLEERPAKLNILIADDNPTDRMILSRIVQSEGLSVIEAANGLEAVEAFKKHRPDLVLLDALMPEMDGFDAAKHIKQLSADDLVPVIFLTSLTDADSLARCLNAGGDDFLTKPYNRIVLKAKIAAMTRLRNLNKTVLAQRDRISGYNKHLLREQEVAKCVFDNIAHPGCVDAPNITYILSPMAVFNGDLLLAARSPSGNLLVFLGDFTGHGLPAAIGAMPVAEIFYGMSLKGFAMSEILKEINRKLVQILPAGVFCCGCMAHFDYRKNVISVWNGGLPDAILYRSDSGEVEQLPSFNLPLGILKPDQFKVAPKELECAEGDQFYMCSDGILEEENIEGEMYGEQRFLDVFKNNTDPSLIFSEQKSALDAFRSTDDQGDDHSLVEIIFRQEDAHETAQTSVIATESISRDWRFSYELRSETLRSFNPLPLLTHIIREEPGLSAKSGELYTILAELYYNALDHGVLGLNSQMKASSDGFAEYYRLKEKRLLSLDGASVAITLDHIPKDNGGRLTIQVEDSGKGFNYKNIDVGLESNSGYSGRGIPLLHKLCERLQYHGKGNVVSVDYLWEYTNKLLTKAG
ncbi:MAG: SpoIIE family protein phosphatase [Pseudomonadales bacterium]|nr:SpoIIE family protein phosphatase [Pseudomonadales bacterium]